MPDRLCVVIAGAHSAPAISGDIELQDVACPSRPDVHSASVLVWLGEPLRTHEKQGPACDHTIHFRTRYEKLEAPPRHLGSALDVHVLAPLTFHDGQWSMNGLSRTGVVHFSLVDTVATLTRWALGPNATGECQLLFDFSRFTRSPPTALPVDLPDARAMRELAEQLSTTTKQRWKCLSYLANPPRAGVRTVDYRRWLLDGDQTLHGIPVLERTRVSTWAEKELRIALLSSGPASAWHTRLQTCLRLLGIDVVSDDTRDSDAEAPPDAALVLEDAVLWAPDMRERLLALRARDVPVVLLDRDPPPYESVGRPWRLPAGEWRGPAHPLEQALWLDGLRHDSTIRLSTEEYESILHVLSQVFDEVKGKHADIWRTFCTRANLVSSHRPAYSLLTEYVIDKLKELIAMMLASASYHPTAFYVADGQALAPEFESLMRCHVDLRTVADAQKPSDNEPRPIVLLHTADVPELMPGFKEDLRNDNVEVRVVKQWAASSLAGVIACVHCSGKAVVPQYLAGVRADMHPCVIGAAVRRGKTSPKSNDKKKTQQEFPWFDNAQAAQRELHVQLRKCLARNRVFVSYERGDYQTAKRVARLLGLHGVMCWIDREHGHAGDIKSMLADQINSCGAMVLLLSRRTMASEFVRHEVEVALARNQREGVSLLVPLKLEKDLDVNAEVRPPQPLHALDAWGLHSHDSKDRGAQAQARLAMQGLLTTLRERRQIGCFPKPEG